MYVRVPFDREYPAKPRTFITGMIKSIDTFSETVTVTIHDPLEYKKYYDYIPEELTNISLRILFHWHINRGTEIVFNKKHGFVVNWRKLENEFYEYYLIDKDTREYFKCLEYEMIAPFDALYTELPKLGDHEAIDATNTIEAPLLIFFWRNNSACSITGALKFTSIT